MRKISCLEVVAANDPYLATMEIHPEDEVPTEYYDWSGKLNRGGNLGDWAESAHSINAFDGLDLVGSLVFEIYPRGAEYHIHEHKLQGPYLFNGDPSQGFIVIYTVFIKPKYRGQGLMRQMLDELRQYEMPVYVNSWQNESLGQYFNQNLGV